MPFHQSEYLPPGQISYQSEYLPPGQISYQSEYLPPGQISYQSEYLPPEQISYHIKYLCVSDVGGIACQPQQRDSGKCCRTPLPNPPRLTLCWNQSYPIYTDSLFGFGVYSCPQLIWRAKLLFSVFYSSLQEEILFVCLSLCFPVVTFFLPRLLNYLIMVYTI